MAAAMGSGRPASYAPADGPRAEIGELCVPLSLSGAFAVASLEGALHENHDRGAAAILPDGTALFACLDGHGQEGASVSGYATRNLLAGCAAALQQGHSASDAITTAYHRTTSTMPQNVSDCRFSGSTAILMVIQHNGAGKRTVTTGWVGDSRAVVARLRVQPGPVRSAPKLETVPLTKDHKPTDPKERERLLAARACVRPSRVMHPHTGAWIEVGAVRVWDASQVYGVAMSRSLGDMQVRPFSQHAALLFPQGARSTPPFRLSPSPYSPAASPDRLQPFASAQAPVHLPPHAHALLRAGSSVSDLDTGDRHAPAG